MNTKILDTNVLLDNTIDTLISEYSFSNESNIKLIIPISVIYELNKHKIGNKKINMKARHNIRFIEQIRQQYGLLTPTEICENVSLEISMSEREKNSLLNKLDIDIEVIKTAKDNSGATIVSNDIILRILCDKIFQGKVESESYNIEENNLFVYSGQSEIELTDEQIQEMATTNKITVNEALLPNQFITAYDNTGTAHYGIYKESTGCIEMLKSHYTAWDIKPLKGKDKKYMPNQLMAMHALLDPSIGFVTINGEAGSAKTFLTLACALEQTLGSKARYKKILIVRPMADADKEIGALPGDKIEKLMPWLAGPIDNLKLLFNIKRPDIGKYSYTPMDTPRDILLDLMNDEIIELESFTFLRGRSFQDTFIIVDDFQNSTKEQAMLAATRVGMNSKIVFLGDISSRQIDDPNITPENNGLKYLIDYMGGQHEALAHLSMGEGAVVRSLITKLAVDLLP